jgi:hypothetical protein
VRAHAGRRVVVRQLDDVVAALPSATEFAPETLPSSDLLITVLGFEERCLAIPEALAGAGHRAGRTVICQYPTNPDDNSRNEQPLRALLGRMCSNEPCIVPIAGDLAAGLREHVEESAPSSARARVVLDISVASNALIIGALSTLLDCDLDLEILYAEADMYRPTRDEYDELSKDQRLANGAELAKGVLDVTTASELPGRHAVGLPHRVIVFPGFDRDRVRAAISQVDNDFIIEIARAPLTWMIGQPLHEEDRWRQAALLALHEVPADHEKHVVSTFRYHETMYALEDVNRVCGLQANQSVIPLGSKMQAVGVTLFCFARPEIAVVVAQPREYSAVSYSRGARQLWHLVLGETRTLVGLLHSVDTIALEPVDDAGAPSSRMGG